MSRRYRIVTVTPAGRKKYLEILVPYLLKNRRYIDEHHFWLNTINREDIEYIESLEEEYPDFFKINRKKMFDPIGWICIWQYFRDYTDENTVYVRFDDDICYFGDDALPKLIGCRLQNQKPFLVYGNVINNTFCSYIHQQHGAIPLRWYKIKDNWDVHVTDSGKLAARIHLKFLRDLIAGNLDQWKFEDYQDANCQVNVISWFGRDLKNIPELLIDDLRQTYIDVDGKKMHAMYEEWMLNSILPKKLGRPNLICGDAIFCHFAFTHQRPYLENMTALLNEYRNIPDISVPGLLCRNLFAPYNRKNAYLKLRSLRTMLSRWNFIRHPLSQHVSWENCAGGLMEEVAEKTTGSEPEISLQSTVLAVKTRKSYNTSGELVIISPRNGASYTLDPIGVRIWDLINKPIIVQDIRDALIREFNVEPGQCEEDVLALLRDMATEGLIKIEPLEDSPCALS